MPYSDNEEHFPVSFTVVEKKWAKYKYAAEHFGGGSIF